MAFLDTYRQQVALLIRVLPFVAEERAFALKGGTAINLFVRDMPRLSVDIDLTYLPVEDRSASLAAIDAAMLRIVALIALELVGHPEQCAVEDGAVIASEFDNARLDDEAAEFDQMPRALATLDLPGAHVMPRLCRPMPVARRPVAPERGLCRAQAPMQCAVPAPERGWRRNRIANAK